MFAQPCGLDRGRLADRSETLEARSLCRTYRGVLNTCVQSKFLRDMQVLPKWRNVLIFRNAFATHSSSTQFAPFHSTPTSCEKWKKKWNSDVRRDQQPSKNYIRYATRQKRADAKKALKDLLFHCGSSKISFQNEEPGQADLSNRSSKKGRSRSSRHAKRAHYNRRQLRRESIFEDFDDHSETVFQSTFGSRRFTWSFYSSEEPFFQSSTTGFERREESYSKKSRHKEWETSSENESYDEPCTVGSFSDRSILGLPPKGPLKVEDIKKAFRLSALKWHPDKHQGTSQAMAEEKFKLCVDAYKSLCNALSTV
ncbi:uncharacterized protein LOC131165521 [Malania oleifera]|uniref:uncharacterized protein LOC131165521 n=1 Tax=Malania oleifera TaxID=397392 RepID=UPI0025ADCE3A|nr:uncharacterized protein LOC131165521 [Malania oleifera]